MEKIQDASVLNVKVESKKIMKLYVVKDLVSGICSAPMDAINDQVAARKFNDMRAKWPNPKEYSLICVGEIDQDQLVLRSDMYIVIEGKAADHVLEAKKGLYPDK